jgi:hypothetical protein
VGWFSRDRRSDAERSLDDLAEDPVEDDEDITLWVRERPASTAPGTRLLCEQSGTTVRVGQPVSLITGTGTQVTSVIALYVDGDPVAEVSEYDLGVEVEVVLADDADLGVVRRSSWIAGPELTLADLYTFVFEVERAEPRGSDALVVGRILKGKPTKWWPVRVSPAREEESPPETKIKKVEDVGDRVGLVLKGLPAERFEPGDWVTWTEPPRGD